jgi:DNA adenine methylase
LTVLVQNEAVTRPLVRWHGGKFRLAPWVLSFFPPHRIYVEPFGGGASVLLRKARSHAEVYNDLDGEIFNLFRMARDHGPELCRLVELTPYARDEYAHAWEATQEPMERARRLLIRAHMGWGSSGATKSSRHGKPTTGFRNNTKRSGTIPATDWSRLPDVISSVVKRMQGVVLENQDAFKLMPAQDDPDAFFYVDPPYLPETRDDARADYRHELTPADHVRLAELLRSLKGKVVLSGYASEVYERLYRGWVRAEAPALADGGRPRTEVLWMNFQPAQEVMVL